MGADGRYLMAQPRGQIFSMAISGLFHFRYGTDEVCGTVSNDKLVLCILLKTGSVLTKSWSHMWRNISRLTYLLLEREAGSHGHAVYLA